MSCEGPRPRCCHCQQDWPARFTLLGDDPQHRAGDVIVWGILEPFLFSAINVTHSLYSTHSGFSFLALRSTYASLCQTKTCYISALTWNILVRINIQTLASCSGLHDLDAKLRLFYSTFIQAMVHDPKWILARLLLGFHMTRGVIINFFSPLRINLRAVDYISF